MATPARVNDQRPAEREGNRRARRHNYSIQPRGHRARQVNDTDVPVQKMKVHNGVVPNARRLAVKFMGSPRDPAEFVPAGTWRFVAGRSSQSAMGSHPCGQRAGGCIQIEGSWIRGNLPGPLLLITHAANIVAQEITSRNFRFQSATDR